MTDEHALPGGLSRLLARLLARLRRAEPKRPRWRHFAPHAVVVVALAALQFFSVTLRNSVLPSVAILDQMLFWGLPLILIPASLLHAFWNWLRSCSWGGAVWLLRPALLGLAFLIFFTPLRQQGKKWDFERLLPERASAVRILLETNPALLDKDEVISVKLPEGFQHLSKDGTAFIQGTQDGKRVVFPARSHTYIYSTSPRPYDRFDTSHYDAHWYIMGW